MLTHDSITAVHSLGTQIHTTSLNQLIKWNEKKNKLRMLEQRYKEASRKLVLLTIDKKSIKMAKLSVVTQSRLSSSKEITTVTRKTRRGSVEKYHQDFNTL